MKNKQCDLMRHREKECYSKYINSTIPVSMSLNRTQNLKAAITEPSGGLTIYVR